MLNTRCAWSTARGIIPTANNNNTHTPANGSPVDIGNRAVGGTREHPVAPADDVPSDGAPSYGSSAPSSVPPAIAPVTSPHHRKSGRLRLASLNVKGFGSADAHGVSDKWYTISQIMREKKLALLGVQEAHLSQDRIRAVEELFGERLTLIPSSDPLREASAGGVAFVINKKSFAAPPVKHVVLVPGRAAMVTLQWSKTRCLRVLNVYAPNRTADNEEFWNQLREMITMRCEWPDVVLGDFNVVESALDRLPHHSDASGAVRALEKMCMAWRVEDSWRRAHAGVREFSYLHAATGSQSRIDRIYLNTSLLTAAANWDISPSGVTTDHLVVSLSLANYQSPETGRGRWKLPLTLLSDPVFVATMKKLGSALQEDVAAIRCRTDTLNAQTMLEAFKTRLREEARGRMKIKASVANRKANELREQLRKALNGGGEPPSNGEVEDDVLSAAVIQNEVMRLEVDRFGKRRAMTAAKDWMYGEVIGKYWVKSTVA
ncbi:Endonuclease/exonuclease/phosphatase, partial [Lenzites betulinus]